MSLKMECHSKLDITQNRMSLKLGTQNVMSPTMEWQSKNNVTQNGMSLKMECHAN